MAKITDIWHNIEVLDTLVVEDVAYAVCEIKPDRIIVSNRRNRIMGVFTKKLTFDVKLLKD